MVGDLKKQEYTFYKAHLSLTKFEDIFHHFDASFVWLGVEATRGARFRNAFILQNDRLWALTDAMPRFILLKSQKSTKSLSLSLSLSLYEYTVPLHP